jgi:hypothetical protein
MKNNFLKQLIFSCTIILFFAFIIINKIAFSNLLINISSYVFDDYFFIPEQSNIFKFSQLKQNNGSGDYWTYGRDNNYYYSVDNKFGAPYIYTDGKDCPSFNQMNVETWCKIIQGKD